MLTLRRAVLFKPLTLWKACNSKDITRSTIHAVITLYMTWKIEVTEEPDTAVFT